MQGLYIPRTLIVGQHTLTEEQLLQQGSTIIVLAEPGAGKTELLVQLGRLLSVTPVRASVFRNRLPGTPVEALVIDAMDEVARIDKLAMDTIVVRASEANCGTVIFAGRSSEWDLARTTYVKECFGVDPIIVKLEPFSEAEQRQLFEASFPAEDFAAFSNEVSRFELLPLLGNPQFLQLLGEAFFESGRVFTSKPKIFSDAVRRLAHEANENLGRQARPSIAEIIDLAGQVFAKLMLSGATGVSTTEALSDRDYPYLPGLAPTLPHKVQFLPDTRLLKPSNDPNQHEPVHRIAAEYCSAQYLVKRIEDPSDRLSLGRVLSVVAPGGVVRDELRGMLGWIAALGKEPMQEAAIAVDSYAVLANGDASQLTTRSKIALPARLSAVAQDDPYFRRSDVWRRFNVGQFFSADTHDTVRALPPPREPRAD